jgi:hypothetical protein
VLAPSSTGRVAATHCPAGHCGELAAEKVGGVQEGRRVVERSRPGPAVCGHHGVADLCLREVGGLLPHNFAPCAAGFDCSVAGADQQTAGGQMGSR